MKFKKKTRSNRFQDNYIQKKIIQGILFLISFVLISIFIFGDHGIFQLYKLEKEKREIKEYISNLREEKERQNVEKNRLENDLNYIEKLAREKYLMSKPGEKVFRIIPKEE
ncbi:septum formation initiator family protein [Candidatus Marinimicrobia bacterium]|jgi:cell division protein FtsB|nr:septum formation initiator family protein [Candidatus Neomarinimicrobiota bacterium]MDA9656720.1 septum formation initiator family protein [Candidatus Neomarinimicrobiota bacterium]MDC0631059.1 septum formation initiator family protein [Candidatus Neomarinimicrobiota bacterium]